MKREWKPGDVLGNNTAGRWFVIGDDEIVDTCGQRYSLRALVGARPLAVIDPEDSRGIAIEIAQKVGDAWHIAPGTDISKIIAAVQAALREFANPTPPKPEEPTGLGAVVEDAKGDLWVRVDIDEDFPWTAHGNDELTYATYSEISAVRKHSEGWSPA